jgi:thioredoxin reductase (NADPH)
VAELGSYEIVVVGAGLAGLTAGLFAARQGRSTLVLEALVPGGHLVSIHQIEDYPGFPEGVAGYELCPLVQEQAGRSGAEFELTEVERVEPGDGGWRVTTAAGAYRAGAVIVASGSRPRPLDAPGAERLAGRGVSHCASCDGAFVRGATVGVVGGGDSALQEALALTEYAARLIVLHRGAALSAQQTYQQRVFQHPAIAVRCGISVAEVLGEDAVSGVRLRAATSGDDLPPDVRSHDPAAARENQMAGGHSRHDPGGNAETLLELAGLFIYIGLAPNSACLRELGVLAPDGRVPTDVWMRTSLPGLLAAGDIRTDSAAQAITAAGDGATAALAAHRYLTDNYWPR